MGRWIVYCIVVLCFFGPEDRLLAAEADTLVRFGEFHDATAIAADPGGFIYVLDRGSNQLLKFSPVGQLLISSGGYGWEGASFDRPADFSLTEGLDFYIADYGNHRIVRLDRQGTFIESFDLRADDPPGQYGFPTGITQSRFGDLFVIDGDNRQLIMIGSARTVQKSFGGIGSGKGTLHRPARIRFGLNDRLYVQDDTTLVMFDLFGNYLGPVPGLAGQAVRFFTVDSRALYVMFGSSLLELSGTGEPRHLLELGDTGEDAGLREAVDILVRDNRVYFLLPHSVVIRPVDGR